MSELLLSVILCLITVNVAFAGYHLYLFTRNRKAIRDRGKLVRDLDATLKEMQNINSDVQSLLESMKTLHCGAFALRAFLADVIDDKLAVISDEVSSEIDKLEEAIHNNGSKSHAEKKKNQ